MAGRETAALIERGRQQRRRLAIGEGDRRHVDETVAMIFEIVAVEQEQAVLRIADQSVPRIAVLGGVADDLQLHRKSRLIMYRISPVDFSGQWTKPILA